MTEEQEMTSDLDALVSELTDAFDTDLRAFVRSRVSEDDEADDIVQDVWLGLVRSIRRGAVIENFEAWLYRSARNRIIDVYRKMKPNTGSDVEDALDAATSDSDPERDLDREEFFDLFEAAISELPDNQREVFMRNEIEGDTLREIAEDADVSLKTIISRKRYAVIKLRVELGEYYEMYFGGE